MESKKYGMAVGIFNSEKWKELREYYNYYNSRFENIDYLKPENEIIEYLQILYFQIDNIIKRTIDYLQTNENLLYTEKDKIFIYSKDLNNLKNNCNNKLSSLNSNNSIDIDKVYFDYSDLQSTQKKTVSKYAYQIAKEFLDFIKIEVSESQETNTKNTSKKTIDENDIKFQVCLNFANGKIYELHKNGVSHRKKTNLIFENHEKEKMIYQYIKCTYSNNSKDIANKSKNLFNNYLLLEYVKKYCIKNNITINDEFLKVLNKFDSKIHD